jgi:uncharacterized protein YdhG (YjbR/CyaY superfamily)
MDAGIKSKTLCRLNGGFKATAHIGQPCIQLGAAIPAFGGAMKEIIYDLVEDRHREIDPEDLSIEDKEELYWSNYYKYFEPDFNLLKDDDFEPTIGGEDERD